MASLFPKEKKTNIGFERGALPFNLFRPEIQEERNKIENILQEIKPTEDLSRASLDRILGLENTFQETFSRTANKALEALQPQLAASGLNKSALGTKTRQDVLENLTDVFLKQAGTFNLSKEGLYQNALAGLAALQKLPLEFRTTLLQLIFGQGTPPVSKTSEISGLKGALGFKGDQPQDFSL